MYDGRLQSVGSQFFWTSVTVQARCDRPQLHPAPALGCDCGLYAYDRLATAALYRRYISAPFNTNLGAILVLGAVLLWGHVVYGEVTDWYPNRAGSDLGLRFRAEFGKVLALQDDGSEATTHACRVHGIPAIREDYLESFAREHGEQLRRPARDRDSGDRSPGRRGA